MEALAKRTGVAAGRGRLRGHTALGRGRRHPERRRQRRAPTSTSRSRLARTTPWTSSTTRSHTARVTSRMRFVAVGELLVDVVADGSGHDARIRLSPAGSAFNAAVAAVAAARGDGFGTVGDDPGGRISSPSWRPRRERGGDGRRRATARSSSRTARSGSTAGWLTTRRPERIGADAVLVSGYVAAAAEALSRADAAGSRSTRRGSRAARGVMPSSRAGRTTTCTPRRRPPARGRHARRSGRRGPCWRTPRAWCARAHGRGRARIGRRLRGDALVALARGADLADALSEATRAALDSLA